ncbi:MAG TPA: hypothetical protein IAA64_06040 [Candidatus Ornithocaccomicrobium faecavium]|uniref:Lipoprotein n=1 Tax=Candidatus Ornithocaccomicrobium faecavium TaxID=2840890 RepID=A0A9D1P6M0_9FIRM|nr:hypothetical protein [Candidatus Ornithocaccomicrobium faecavium]
MKVKFIAIIALCVIVVLTMTGCSYTSTQQDMQNTRETANSLAERQPTPTDIEYSLERYNLTRRAYWVNGMRERARTLPCPIADVPLGYVVLLTESGSIVGRFEVDGKVSSLNSYLTPDSTYYSSSSSTISWIADVDGSYGTNDNGVFFFTPDGKYVEWNGSYLYSDIPFEIKNPVVTYAEDVAE